MGSEAGISAPLESEKVVALHPKIAGDSRREVETLNRALCTNQILTPNMHGERFDFLSERQRDYLRQVFQHRNSQQIAYEAGVSARAVDKQLLLAKNILGVTSRFEAARLFAEHEAGVEGFYPASVAPSRPAFWPLPLPVPTKARPLNTLRWQQVLAWGVIIAIVAPTAITAAAMLIMALALLIGVHLG